jgi:hypothetical protein
MHDWALAGDGESRIERQRLLLQAIRVLRQRRRQNFNGDIAREIRVVGATHFAPPSFAEEIDDYITAESCAGREPHTLD